MEEYDEGQEVTTRPRLTKEQVEVLENEFLKNCKPSSMLKRQLAAHTSLSLNRVAVSYPFQSVNLALTKIHRIGFRIVAPRPSNNAS